MELALRISNIVRQNNYTFPQILDNPLSLVHLLLRMAYNKREGGQR